MTDRRATRPDSCTAGARGASDDCVKPPSIVSVRCHLSPTVNKKPDDDLPRRGPASIVATQRVIAARALYLVMI